MKSIRWICVQELGDNRFWYYEPSLSYTRSESIRLRMDGCINTTWRKARTKHHWKCVKVVLEINHLTTPKSILKFLER